MITLREEIELVILRYRDGFYRSDSSDLNDGVHDAVEEIIRYIEAKIGF